MFLKSQAIRRQNNLFCSLNLTFCKEFVKDDNRPTNRAVSAFRGKRKRSAVSKEQNMAVCGMHDPL